MKRCHVEVILPLWRNLREVVVRNARTIAICKYLADRVPRVSVRRYYEEAVELAVNRVGLGLSAIWPKLKVSAVLDIPVG
jgi:hypothetical protein